MRKEDCLYKMMCEEECNSACARYSVTKYMLEHSNIPRNKWGLNQLVPEDCDIPAFTQLAEIKNNIADFVKRGDNLYIYSKICGNGKTTWAIKLMLQYFNDIWETNGFRTRGVFMPVSEFLYRSKANISTRDELFEIMKNDCFNVDLVIWDDIACGKMSDFDFNLLLAFIDTRVVNGKANIFTGNIIPSELDKYVGNKLASRINGSTKIQLLGGDNR